MNLLNVLFPVKCPLCGGVQRNSPGGICEECRNKLPLVEEPCCKKCGKPVFSLEEEYCQDCRKKTGSLEQGTALWVYTDKMKKAMADFKYGGCMSDSAIYAKELLFYRGNKIMSWRPEGIVPVPLHWRKKWFRGYNQAACIAEALGESLHLPVYSELLVRLRYTKPQKGLDDRQRAENLKGAIGLNERAGETISQLRSVLLVDDIYTTGATLEECAKVLKKQGVQRVYFACLCIGRDY